MKITIAMGKLRLVMESFPLFLFGRCLPPEPLAGILRLCGVVEVEDVISHLLATVAAAHVVRAECIGDFGDRRLTELGITPTRAEDSFVFGSHSLDLSLPVARAQFGRGGVQGGPLCSACASARAPLSLRCQKCLACFACCVVSICPDISQEKWRNLPRTLEERLACDPCLGSPRRDGRKHRHGGTPGPPSTAAERAGGEMGGDRERAVFGRPLAARHQLLEEARMSHRSLEEARERAAMDTDAPAQGADTSWTTAERMDMDIEETTMDAAAATKEGDGSDAEIDYALALMDES